MNSLEIAARDFENTKGLTSWVCPDCKIDFETPFRYRAHRGPSYVDICGWFDKTNEEQDALREAQGRGY